VDVLRIISGGLLGLYLVAGNMSYVAVMVINLGVDPLRENVGTVMAYPISAMLSAILLTINKTRLLRFMPKIFRTIVGITLIIGVPLVIFIATIQMKLLYSVALYTAIIIVLSFGLSYTIGMSEGLRSADPALNYPLVTLEMRDGGRLERAWLYERTDSDYRLVTENGANHVVPAANVKEITGPLESPSVSTSSSQH